MFSHGLPWLRMHGPEAFNPDVLATGLDRWLRLLGPEVFNRDVLAPVWTGGYVLHGPEAFNRDVLATGLGRWLASSCSTPHVGYCAVQ